MKKPEELHKELINENYIDLKPINTIETRAKDPFWSKFESFLAEGESLILRKRMIKLKIMKANTVWTISWLVHLRNLKL